MRYPVVLEHEGESYGAYVPDLPGCVAVATSEEEVLQMIQEAIEMHLEAMREEGDVIPAPGSHVRFVEVADAG